MAAVVPHHPLGRAGGSGRVKDVKGVGGLYVHRTGGFGGSHGRVPVQPACMVRHRRCEALTCLDQYGNILGTGEAQRLGDGRQVLDAAGGFNST